MSRTRNIALTALMLTLSLAFSLALLEVGVRLWGSSARFSDWYAGSYTYLLDGDTDWKLEPRAYSSGETVNARWFRGSLVGPEKPPGMFRILVLGGSAAFDMHKADRDTWPSRLEGMLRERTGRNVQVINAAVPGYSTWQSYRLLQRRMEDYQPDLVLVYHLYNDSLAFRHDSEEKIAAGWKLNAWANHISPVAVENGPLDFLGALMPRTVDIVRMHWVLKAAQRTRAANDAFWLDRTLAGEVHPVGFGFYRKNLEGIIADVRAHGSGKVAIVSQASLLKGVDPRFPLEGANYAYRGLSPARLLAAYEQAWAIDRDLAARHDDVIFIPAHERLPSEAKYFVDEVHLSAAGSTLLAEILADEMDDLVLQGQP